MSKALLRFIRLSPTKARLVAKEVQGMNAELALASLEFTPNKAARIIAKVIASAIANGGYEPKSAIVHSCRVDAGPVLRRFMPRARGRATPIRKPTSHILVEVMNQSEIDAFKTSLKNNKKTATKAKTKAESKKDSATKAGSTTKPTTSTKIAKEESKVDSTTDATTKATKKANTKSTKETKASETTKVAKSTPKSKTTKKDEDK